MDWRDLLYFSKGERRALTLLLCLITISFILLLWTDTEPMPIASQTDARRMEKGQASDGRRTVTAKETSEGKKNYTRQTSGFPPKETKKALTAKNPAHKGNVSSSIGKKKAGYKAYPRTEKFPAGTIVELNTADTTTLKKVPGIGSTFARRIVKYRELLGGFYTIRQLAEVYGIDEERYAALVPWFTADTLHIRKLNVNSLSAASLRRHPYLDDRQAKAIEQLRQQKSRLSGWENLQLIEEFTETDRRRLAAYLSFD